MADWLRISFTDDGAEYVIDKRRDTSMSARIILGSVDDFHTEWKDGKPVYCMDFLYDEYLDVKGYLLRSKEA
jgi:fatty-acyl-CoA synthase